jgi:hypothetical protein
LALELAASPYAEMPERRIDTKVREYCEGNMLSAEHAWDRRREDEAGALHSAA